MHHIFFLQLASLHHVLILFSQSVNLRLISVKQRNGLFILIIVHKTHQHRIKRAGIFLIFGNRLENMHRFLNVAETAIKLDHSVHHVRLSAIERGHHCAIQQLLRFGKLFQMCTHLEIEQECHVIPFNLALFQQTERLLVIAGIDKHRNQHIDRHNGPLGERDRFVQLFGFLNFPEISVIIDNGTEQLHCVLRQFFLQRVDHLLAFFILIAECTRVEIEDVRDIGAFVLFGTFGVDERVVESHGFGVALVVEVLFDLVVGLVVYVFAVG
mmetsp:Transcript_32986/g.52850  ORF Transcript_32986/g.52850 Transcript_32986/m.52850 type:complete len:269 (+) Transcript_32986:408-1214(+)